VSTEPRTAAPAGRPALLVLGCGADIYREYALAGLASRADVLLLTEGPAPPWARRHARDSADARLSDVRSLAAAARRLASCHDVRGVLTYDEMLVGPTAELAESLGLPGNSPSVAGRCRDKLLMREAWERAGVPSARSRAVATLADAWAAAGEIGYPVVLKPRGMAGSVGVVRAASRAELARAWEQVGQVDYPKYGTASRLLLEEYLEGPEISVESAVVDGVCRPVAVTRKQLGALPFFEEVGHVVSTRDPLPERPAALAVTAAAHAALGIRAGVTHAELRLTPQGPRLVEIGARLAGDLIPRLVTLASGVDLVRAAADIAMGEAPDLAPRRRGAAAVRFFYPAADCVVRALGDRLQPRPDWLDRIEWKATVGAVLRLPPCGFLSRIGFAVVTGADGRQCRERLDLVERRLQLDLQILGPREEERP
jgi:biotin carboxylase